MGSTVNREKKVSVEQIIHLITTLRGENGCPWDKKQTPDTLAPYLVEEAYELVDAVLSDDAQAVCEEAGDVLFQLLFLIHLFTDTGRFNFQEVVERNLEKMIRRHPHVFAGAKAETPDQVRDNWQKMKKEENQEAGRSTLSASIPQGLPALLRASLVSARAAQTGFDWEDLSGVMEKAVEEWREFSHEIDQAGFASAGNKAATEFGDLLFTLVNVARFAGIHPETALIRSIQKFEKRFAFMEKSAFSQGRQIEELSSEELNALWEQAKRRVG